MPRARRDLIRPVEIPLLTRFCLERMGGAPAVRELERYGDMGIYNLSSPWNP